LPAFEGHPGSDDSNISLSPTVGLRRVLSELVTAAQNDPVVLTDAWLTDTRSSKVVSSRTVKHLEIPWYDR
jgi:hypothetical protein